MCTLPEANNNAGGIATDTESLARATLTVSACIWLVGCITLLLWLLNQ